VQRLIDGVIDYLPNPSEVPESGHHPKDEEEKLTRPHDDTAPFSALVFKVVNDTHGDLTYMRIYSGKLEKGSRVLNPGNGKREIASAASSRCTPRTARPSTRSAPATSSPSSASRTRSRATRSATR
jgi:translation elongation factor EF-G